MTDPRDMPNDELRLALINLNCTDPDDRTPDDEARIAALRSEYARRNPGELDRAWRAAVDRGDVEHAADLDELRRVGAEIDAIGADARPA